MAALVTNKTQADAVGSNTMNSGAVAGAGGGIGSVSDATVNGIDDANTCSFLQFNGQATTANTHYSAYRTFATATNGYDLSSASQAFHIHLKQNNLQFNNYTSNSDSLWLILFSDGGTTNYARWEMNIQDFIDGGWKIITMSGTPDTSSGFTNTDVTGYGLAIEMADTTSENYGCSIQLDQLIYIDGAVVLEDTGAAAQLNQESYFDELKATSGNSFHSNLNYELKPAYSYYHGVLFETDDLSLSNFALIFQPNDEVTGGFQVDTADYYTLEFNPDSGTASQALTDGFSAYSGGTYDLTINSASLTSGTWTSSNYLALNTRNVTIGGNSQATVGITIPNPTGTVDVSDVGGTLTITGTSSAIQWTADFAANTELITDSDIDITFAETDLSDITLTLTGELTISVDPTTGSGTYDLSGISTSSTLRLWNKDTANATTITVPSGITTEKIDLWFNYDTESGGPFVEQELLTFGNGATATLRVLVDNGTTGTMYCTLVSGSAPPDNNSITGGTSSATALVNEASGANNSTLTISQPVVSFTINTNVSALIQIYTTNTQTVLDSTTGTSLVFNHSGQTIDYTIQAAGYIPQRFTSETLSGTTSTTINLVADPVYNASHGLTFTTDYSYNANTRVMTIVANQEGRNLYSALIDDFQTETALRNCPFPLTAVGPDRIDFNAVGYYNSATTVGATIDSGDIQFWKGAGMQWEHDTTGNPTKKFYSIKSSNTLVASSVVGYTQVLAGTPVEATLVSNQVNQVIQFFEDTNGDGTPDYNYTGHLLFKGFLTGYYQARWDVINDGGVTTLEPYEYNISLTQDAIAGTTGDQSITITTLTDHTGAPISVGGKNFDYELVDPGTNTAENLLAQHNYNVYNAVNTSISGSLYTSYQAFDLPDLVVEAGSNYETERGYFEGDGAVTDLSGVYLSRSAADHPGISRFQSNDGTYYTPATVAQISAPNLTAGRIQVVNETGRTASAWAATTAYSLYNKVLRSTGTGSESGIGLYFQCTTAGTSGGSEPTWDTTPGNTTADGTVTWTCRAIEFDNDTTTSGYSNSWTDHEDFDNGDTIRLRWVDEDDLEIEATGVATAEGTTSFLNTPSDDTVYDGYGIDGSTVTEYSADYPNVQVDLNDPDNVFYLDRFYAWHKYNLTLADGIRNFFGAVTATNASNITINNSVVDIFFDNTKAVSARQGDNIVIQRADGAYPQVTTTSGGGGLGFYYTGVGYTVETGVSGLTPTESAKITSLTFSKTNELDVNIKSVQDTTVTGAGTAGDPWGP